MQTEQSTFETFILSTPFSRADIDPDFPSRLMTWGQATARDLLLPDDGTHFGYVATGEVCIQSALIPEFTARAGNYFSLAGKARISNAGGLSSGIVITRLGYFGFNQVGGPIEEEGRLRYIDGCTDSLLISPVKAGEACLNLLYFPASVDQTWHTHPSVRCGVVSAGSGECHTDSGVTALSVGLGFIIGPNTPHKFRTGPGSSMSVIAYHPDSDFGPTDHDHPMINRTMVDGRSARFIAAIQTRDI